MALGADASTSAFTSAFASRGRQRSTSPLPSPHVRQPTPQQTARAEIADMRVRRVGGDEVAGAEAAASEALLVLLAVAFSATLTLNRAVSADALVAVWGNRYSVPPEHVGAIVEVTQHTTVRSPATGSVVKFGCSPQCRQVSSRSAWFPVEEPPIPTAPAGGCFVATAPEPIPPLRQRRGQLLQPQLVIDEIWGHLGRSAGPADALAGVIAPPPGGEAKPAVHMVVVLQGGAVEQRRVDRLD